ncbi:MULTISPECIES: hypothetical protein [Streptomyces]|uniref:hypothetical protein n=1 Tax=Streptomyces TaxID=1883 RepID=UPI00166FDB0A|nr:hypothetical protein [Streptomyces ruber]
MSNVGRTDLTDVTVTIDASALAAVSDEVDVDCDPDGDLVGVCDGIGPVRRGVPVRIGEVRVGRPKISAVDTSHPVRVTATDGNGARGTHRFTVAVPTASVVFDRAAGARERPAPGGTLRLPGGFTNYTRSSVPAVRVTLGLSRGLSLSERFRDCVRRTDEDTLETTVECKVLGPFDPLASYDLGLGAVRADARAMWEHITYDVRSVPPDEVLIGDSLGGDGSTELTAAGPPHPRTYAPTRTAGSRCAAPSTWTTPPTSPWAGPPCGAVRAMWCGRRSPFATSGQGPGQPRGRRRWATPPLCGSPCHRG